MKIYLKIFIVIIILIIVGAAISAIKVNAPVSGDINENETSDTTLNNSISDGIITVRYNEKEFGLAVNQQQILVKSYIPPCNEDFNYCFYYIGNEYQGTNFESAGIRIQKRDDLSTERICLDTPPAGYDSSVKPSSTNSADKFSTSVFKNIGDAAAGHYAKGELHRLFVRASSTCYEFETRIGQSQYANYPEGSIKKFTDQDETALLTKLNNFLKNITIKEGVEIF